MFDGQTYEPEQDEGRLKAQLEQVKEIMLDGQWRTLSDLQSLTGHSTASLSARLRDLRKEKFGGYSVERERLHGGTHAYRVKRVETDLFGDPVASFAEGPEKQLFSEGLKIATSKGRSEKSCRGQLAKLAKEHGAQSVLDALYKAEGMQDPLNYARGILGGQAQTSGGLAAFLAED